MSIIDESWQDIPRSPNYQVSTLGRIRTRPGVLGIRGGRIHKPVCQRGYYYVKLGGNVRRTVHSIVAEVFLGTRPLGMEINHEDGDKSNNHPGNLNYQTSSGNKQHAIRMGLGYAGARNSKAVLTADDVLEIRKARKNGESCHAISTRYLVSAGHISRVTRRHWTDISRPPDDQADSDLTRGDRSPSRSRLHAARARYQVVPLLENGDDE